MGKLKFAALIVAITVLVLLLIFYLVGYFKPKSAGLLIETEPVSTVYIDGTQVGRTPFDTTKAQGEITLKLIPDSFDKPLVTFESKLSLVSGVKTIVRRNFGESNETSDGVIISFEKVSGEEVGIAIISYPDAAQVTIDGQVRDFTPYKSSTFSAGDHTISITLDGYQESTIDVKTYVGYKLMAEFNLAKDVNAKSEPTPTPKSQEEEKPRVKILSTPTGFLRVRSEPSTLAKEVGQVSPDEIYEILEEDKETGWFKIEFEEGEEGWISNQYASKVESTKATPTPTTTPKATLKD